MYVRHNVLQTEDESGGKSLVLVQTPVDKVREATTHVLSFQ